MNTIRTHLWRICLVASGVILAAGGPMHPESDAKDSLREELATMTADERWVPGHSLIVVSTILLATGLWIAWRDRVWPERVQRTLGFAAAAVSLYVVETVAHLAAARDSHALAHGDAAPVAFTHIGLSVFLYPLTGIAIVALALSFARAQRGWRKPIVGLGVLAGTLHAISVPATLILPDVEFTPVFAGAALTLAIWSLATGLVGAPKRATAPEPAPVAVRSLV